MGHADALTGTRQAQTQRGDVGDAAHIAPTHWVRYALTVTPEAQSLAPHAVQTEAL